MITIHNPTAKDTKKLDSIVEALEKNVTELPVFTSLDDNDNHEELAKKAEEFYDRFPHIVWFGTGGSSLGSQAVCELDPSPKKRITFCNNIDPKSIHDVLAYCALKTSGFIFASKSGNTSETVMQLMAVIQLLEKRGYKPAHHIILLAQKGDHTFAKFAKYYNIEILPHPSDIGGRFSVFSVTGMFPALLSQINVCEIRESAKSFVSDKNNLVQAAEFALWYNEQYKADACDHVILPYCDRMKLFGDWMCQLWAESLGKKNKKGTRFGSLPVTAVGTVFQHSQLQLYLDGPKNKVMSFITLNNHPNDEIIESPLRNKLVTDLNGHTFGQLMKSHSQACFDVCKNHGIPSRHIVCEEYNEKSLGQLMANGMLEVLALAHLWGIDPFDQPAVEEGKTLALANLCKS